MNLKDPKYDGKGGLWKAKHPLIAAQGNVQIGGRTIALTIWYNHNGGKTPDFNITVNDQKTSFEDMTWFKSLSPPPKIVGRKADIIIVDDLDDDIPF